MTPEARTAVSLPPALRGETGSELLFAVAALRRGLFSSREFTDICTAWAGDQRKGLRDRFCERLTPSQVQALDEEVMLAFLGQNADDPGRTVDLPETKEQVFKTLGTTAAPDEDCSCADAEATVTPETTGRYETRQELGRGGIGRVLLAFDRHIGREIALKEILPGVLPEMGSDEKTPSHPSQVVRARFLREARVTGQLEHPSIVPVYEIGRRADGTCYYTMRMIKGRTLARAIAQSLDLEERLKLLPHFYDLCNAIAYAHSRGVLHRDIKPENVMIGEFGETVVLDWGLAKVRGQTDHGARHLERRIHTFKESDAGKTLSGRVLGTPAYMPPEQALGEIDRLDERSDLYSLGAVLYEILTGQRPFSGGSPFEILGKVLKERPADIRSIEPAAPTELIAIVEKAMRRPKEQRYPQVTYMTQDIQNYLAGGRVSAYSYSAFELTGKFLRKHKVFTVSATLALLLILVGTALVYREYLRSQRSLMVSRALLFADRSRQYEESRDYGASLVFAAAALLNNPAAERGPAHIPGIERIHPEVVPLYAGINARIYKTQQSMNATLERMFVADGPVWAVAFSPDGGRLAAAGQMKDAPGVVLWNALDGTPSGRLTGFSGNGFSVAFSPDGTRIAAGTQESAVALWDARSGKVLEPLRGHGGPVFGVAFSPDGERLASAGMDGLVKVWRLGDGREIASFDAHRDGALCVAFSPDGNFVVSGGWDKRVALWNLRTGKATAITAHSDAVSAVAFSPDGRRIASGGHDRAVIYWNLTTGLYAPLGSHRRIVTALSFSKSGRYLASGGDDGAARIWDTRSGTLALHIGAFRQAVTALVFRGDELLAAGGNDKRVRLWRIGSGGGAMTYHGHTARVVAVRAVPGENIVVSAAEDGTLRFWDVQSGLEILQLDTSVGIRALEVSPDGKLFAAAGLDRIVRLWRSGELKPFLELKGHGDTVRALAFSPDGRSLLSGGEDRTVVVWDPETGVQKGRHGGHRAAVGALAVAADGRHYLSGDHDGALVLRAMADGSELMHYEFTGAVKSVRFLPGDALVIAGGEASGIALYDRATAARVQELNLPAGGLSELAVSSDGALAAAVTEAGVTRIFSLRNGRPLLYLDTVDGRTAAFPAGGSVLFASDGDDIRRYSLDAAALDIDPAAFFEEAQRRSGLRLKGAMLEPVE